MSARIIPFPPPAPPDPPLADRLAPRREYREIASAAAKVAFGQAFQVSMQNAAGDKATAHALLLEDAMVLFLAAMRRELQRHIEAGQL